MDYNADVSRRGAPDIESELSQRELQLLVHASRGLTDQAIAIELGISLATIATYWGRIRIKLGPLNRTELVAKYLDFKSREEISSLQNEVEVLREQLENTKIEDSFLLLALNKIPSSVIVIDLDSIIRYVNEATCRWFGYSPDDMVGNHFLEFYPEGRHELWQAWREKFLKEPDNPEVARNRPAYVRHKDGSLVALIGDTVLFDTSAGQQIMWVSRLAD